MGYEPDRIKSVSEPDENGFITVLFDKSPEGFIIHQAEIAEIKRGARSIEIARLNFCVNLALSGPAAKVKDMAGKSLRLHDGK